MAEIAENIINVNNKWQTEPVVVYGILVSRCLRPPELIRIFATPLFLFILSDFGRKLFSVTLFYLLARSLQLGLKFLALGELFR